MAWLAASADANSTHKWAAFSLGARRAGAFTQHLVLLSSCKFFRFNEATSNCKVLHRTSLPRCALHDICDASEREEGAGLQVGPPASTCIRCGKSSFSSVNLDWRLRELMFMNEYPDTPFLTVFDYRRGKAEIKLHQLDTFAHRTGLKLGAEWDNDVARAAQSGGRMALPLFCASEAGRCRYWIVPLRSASATVHEASEGLRRLVACLPRNLGTWNIPELLCQIQNLIDSGGKQIHQETGDFTCQMDPILDFATVPLGSLENHLCCAR